MMATAAKMKSVQLFYCYAEEDTSLRDELAMHLKALERTHVIKTWHDQPILPGESWKQQVEQALNTAHVAVLLISAHFLGLDFFTSPLLREAIERHRRGENLIIPVLLRQCQWQETSLAQLDMLPTNGRPVTTWADRDEAWCDVASEVRTSIKNFFINPWLEEAETLLQQGHYAEAIAIYDQILHLDRENVTASIGKGNAYLRVQRFAEALNAYEQARRHRSTLEKPQMLRQGFPRNNQFYEEALQVYNQLLQQKAFSPPPSNAIGEMMLEDIPRSLLHSATLAELNEAIQRNPVNPFLYYIKGNISLELERYEAALGAYEQAMRLKQDFESARLRFSRTLEQISQQEYQKLNLLARQALERAHRLRDT
ncbi:MAG: TIR domain-containing protein [Ktedonobacteraceae bacterium]|nr:TIR domain-containing protein [Ktedonobacteraceae bacterium]